MFFTVLFRQRVRKNPVGGEEALTANVRAPKRVGGVRSFRFPPVKRNLDCC
jgi:hypothetical protein